MIALLFHGLPYTCEPVDWGRQQQRLHQCPAGELEEVVGDPEVAGPEEVGLMLTVEHRPERVDRGRREEM